MNVHEGEKVGAQRWPYAAAHPDCWGRPWAGVVLAQDDPQAWARTLRFTTDSPDPAEVRAWVEHCHAEGLLDSAVPVLWAFDEPRVYWQDVAGLRPYADDLAAWFEARGRAWIQLAA